VFCKSGLGLGLEKWQWQLSSGQKTCACAGCIDTTDSRLYRIQCKPNSPYTTYSSLLCLPTDE